MLKGICSRLCGVCVCVCVILYGIRTCDREFVCVCGCDGCQLCSNGLFMDIVASLSACMQLCNYAKYITCYVASIQLEMRWNASQPATYTFESVCVRNIISLNGYGQMDIACDSEWTRIEMESANSCIRFDFQKKRDVLNIEHR